jgi:hypothetical protein
MKQDGHEDSRVSRSTPLTLVEEEILKSVRRIRYGSVEITIHDSRVVQIEQKEKVRIGGESSGGGRR